MPGRRARRRVDTRFAGLAMDLRTHPLSRLEAARPLGLRYLRRVLDHRLSGRRAEPLAPASRRSPSSRSTSPWSSRIETRRCARIPGSISSSPAPGFPRTTRSRILREFLLRGGTLTFDDFHGNIEWANLERQMKRVFPESQDHRPAAEASDLPLLLSDRRVSADAGLGLVPRRAGRGRRAATSRACGPSRTTTAGRWC